MASELRRNETQEQEEKSIEETEELLSSNEEAESKHEFSSPWRNSDLVLIIEDQKIHVHRVILEMASPVLCHIFKETDSNEVPLPRTNVRDFLELLKLIYPQFEKNITLDNIEQIYRLAEEYQVESAMKVCREFLIHAKKTTTNAMKILVTAQVCDVDEARKQCYEILKGLTVAELKSDQHFKGLDEQSLRSVLLPKAERLEKCLREIQPQLVGLIDCALYFWFCADKPKQQSLPESPNKCPVHQRYTKASTNMQTRIKCSACKAMFAQMAENSEYTHWQNDTKHHYYSDTGTYFDKMVVGVLKEMFSLLKM